MSSEDHKCKLRVYKTVRNGRTGKVRYYVFWCSVGRHYCEILREDFWRKA